MEQKKKHPKKGDFGYYKYEKKKRGLIVALLFGICLLIFFTGLIMTGTRKNMFSLVAILGVLPAAKWAVQWIMVLLQKDAPQEVYDETEKIAKDLVHGYELCVTAYEGRYPIDALVVCGNIVAAYSRADQVRIKKKTEKVTVDGAAFTETHIRKILHGNDLGNNTVKIFTKFEQYKERIRQLAADPDKYREGLKYVPDEQHEGETRDQAMLRVIKNISI